MRKVLIFILLIIFFNNSYALVFFGSSYVVSITNDSHYASTRMVAIKWYTREVNMDHYEIRRTTDPNWGSYVTITNNINACGTCLHAHYEYIDNGPFTEGVQYYYRVVAIGGWGQVKLHDIGNVIFAVPISKDWKKQITDKVVIGETPADRNAYTWHEENNVIQGVIVSLSPSERMPIYLQANSKEMGQKVVPQDIDDDVKVYPTITKNILQ